MRTTPSGSVPVVEQAREVGRQEHVTLLMLLFSAFAVVLQRYSGQRDLVIGTPLAGRSRPALEPLIGFFVNVLPLRLHLGEQQSVRALLRQVREVCLGAYEHQELPFERLVEELHPQRSLQAHPLFPVLFILQNTPQVPETFHHLQVEKGTVPWSASDFDLTLEFQEVRGTLRGRLEYSTDLFARQVQRSPDAIALVCGEQHLSYQAVEARANQLAHALQRQGIGPERRVGLCLPQSVEQVIAVLKAGGAYVPLDPNYPAERLAFMLQDAHVCLLVTQQALSERIASVLHQIFACTQESLPTLYLESHAHASDQLPASAPASMLPPANLAYVICTSGSTGRAKGVVVTHASLVQVYLAWEHHYELRTRIRCHLQMASFSFLGAHELVRRSSESSPTLSMPWLRF